MSFGKIVYQIPPWKDGFSHASCEACGEWIDEGDECYYHGDGLCTCSLICAEKFDK